MRRWAKGILGLGGGFLLLASAFLGGLVVREYRREPLPLLDLPAAPLVLRAVRESAFRTTSGEDRRLVEVDFEGAPEGPVRIALSLPPGPERPLPVVVILGGLEAGRDSLRYVDRHGPNALVAYAYPRPTADLYEGQALFKVFRIRRAALAVPSQVSALLAWIPQQPWADGKRLSLLGYSFGAMFIPATARVAQGRGVALHTLVMAYGGADLPALLAANASLRPAWIRPLAARTVGAVVRPLEPALHLPHLPTEALFLTGLQDEQIPLQCARLMQALKPPPKTVLDLEAGHMDPDRPELNRRIIEASTGWLVARGALMP